MGGGCQQVGIGGQVHGIGAVLAGQKTMCGGSWLLLPI
jgi:hypothetical protein